MERKVTMGIKEKIKVKRVIEILQGCNPEADFGIIIDNQIPAQNMFISCGYKDHEEKKKNSIRKTFISLLILMILKNDERTNTLVERLLMIFLIEKSMLS